MSGRYLRPSKTPTTPERFYGSFRRADPTLGSESLLVLVAHVCLESDDGRAVRAWNVGGAKAKPGGDYDWTFFSTSEIEHGLRVRYTAPPEDRQPLITAANATFAERVCCFRAFESLDAATADHVRLIRDRFNVAWPHVLTPDPDAYARALKSARYYTADPDQYASVLEAKFHRFADESRGWSAAAGWTPPLGAA